MFVENGGDPAKKEEEKLPLFDDNGDLIEDDEEAEGEDEEDEDTDTEGGEDDEEDADEDDSESDGEEDADPDADTEDGEDADEEDSDDGADGDDGEEDDATAGEDELTSLKKEFARFKAQTKATMKALGNENVETLEDLQKLAAESEGITVEDYQKRSVETDEVEAAKAFIRRARAEKMLADDLADIKKVFPTMGDVKSVKELPNFKRFGELRDAGIPAAEAFAASHGEMIAKRAVEASKRQSLNGTKNHIRSDASKKAKGENIQMTEKEMDRYRDLLPGMTDKEIREIYKRVCK